MEGGSGSGTGTVSHRMRRALGRLNCLRRSIHTTDVAILGGGPAGLSLAAALRGRRETCHLDVSIIDSQPLESLSTWADNKNMDSYENRVVSLTPRTIGHLNSIGAWNNVILERTVAYDEMKVWDGLTGVEVNFDPWIMDDRNEIATMIENKNIQQACYALLSEDQIFDSRKVANISRSSNEWPLLTFDDGSQIETRLLVGADGPNSPVRRFAGIESRGWDYNRDGVVATLKLEYDNYRACAYQRMLPSGPLALLPLPEGHASMVWSTYPDRSSWLKAASGQTAAAMINAGFRLESVDLDFIFEQVDPRDSAAVMNELDWRMPPESLEREDLPVPVLEVQPGSMASFPLRMRHADTYIAKRIALVGDAAHTTHPLAGQGLNMGQCDVQHLVDALSVACDRGVDIGESLALEPYWKAAYVPNHLKLGVFDKIHKLYSTSFWPIVQLRSLGAAGVESSDTVKRFLMKQASML